MNELDGNPPTGHGQLGEAFRAVENEQLQCLKIDAIGLPKLRDIEIRIFAANGIVEIFWCQWLERKSYPLQYGNKISCIVGAPILR